MDRSKCAVIRERLNAVLAKLGEELGLVIRTVGGGSFTSTSLTLKVEAAEKGEGGLVMSKEANAYKTLAGYNGLPAETLGWTFTSNGKQFTIRGYNAKARSMPIMCDADDGRGYKFPVETVKALLAMQHGEKFTALLKK